MTNASTTRARPASEGAVARSAHARSGKSKRIRECIQTMCTLDHRFGRGSHEKARGPARTGVRRTSDSQRRRPCQSVMQASVAGERLCRQNDV